MNCSTIQVIFLNNISFQVQYQSDHFLDKNKDYVVPEHQDLLSASKCPFVAGLFPQLPEETSKSSKFSSIGSRFKVVFLLFFLGDVIVDENYMYYFISLLKNTTNPFYATTI